MDSPTDAQIEEFWQWCGFKHTDSPNEFIRRNWWTNPEHHCESHLPDINLDSLFKYAVPEVMEHNQNFVDLQVRRYIAPGYDDFLISYTCEIWPDNGQGSIIKQANTPALALFWAIWEVISRVAPSIKGGK